MSSGVANFTKATSSIQSSEPTERTCTGASSRRKGHPQTNCHFHKPSSGHYEELPSKERQLVTYNTRAPSALKRAAHCHAKVLNRGKAQVVGAYDHNWCRFAELSFKLRITAETRSEDPLIGDERPSAGVQIFR
ncbi:hypothetical protein TYRP_009153 [Tyrophagus putrescentiae]|nr:hypothetical protein TYRP_009153 [Tyrophagus putrescentiae]